jgi:hypothetical protein
MTRMRRRTLKSNFERLCMMLLVGVFLAAFALSAAADPVSGTQL